MMPPLFFASGLDLGQQVNHSAFGTVGKQRLDGVSHYHLVGLEHFPLGTPYLSRKDRPGGSVTERVYQIVTGGPLRGKPIAMDRGEVGKVVIEEFYRMNLPASIIGISITGGETKSFRPEDQRLVLPKRELVMKLLTIFEAGRFHFSAELVRQKSREVEQFKRELAAFKTRVKKSGHQTFAGEEEQDDIVCCAAYAVYIGESTTIEPDAFGYGGPQPKPPPGAFAGGQSVDKYKEGLPEGMPSPREAYGWDGQSDGGIPGIPTRW